MSPVFSVVMPMFNASKTVLRSIHSVQCQVFADWELIVVNDQSTDDCAQIVADIASADSRVKLIHQSCNAGVSEARNAAIRLASGRYICFLDSDDLWLPNKLEQQYILFQKGALIVYSAYYRQLVNGERVFVPARTEISLKQFYRWNPIGNLTGAYDSHCLGKIQQIKHGHEDYIMWFHLLKKAGKAVGIEEPLAIYSVSEGSLSGSKAKAAVWQWQILRGQFKLNRVEATFYFCAYAWHAIGQRLLARGNKLNHSVSS